MTLTAKEIEKRFEEHHERMHLLEVDMWFGKDQQNPSVVTRLLLIEEAISSLKTIKWLLVGAVATALFNILSTHIKF